MEAIEMKFLIIMSFSAKPTCGAGITLLKKHHLVFVTHLQRLKSFTPFPLVGFCNAFLLALTPALSRRERGLDRTFLVIPTLGVICITLFYKILKQVQDDNGVGSIVPRKPLVIPPQLPLSFPRRRESIFHQK